MSGARRDGKPSDDKPATKPMSDWDRAQAELRGEKPAMQPATGGARPPSVRDIILRVLADNGNHLTRLRDDEKITVVVTFRDGDTFFAPMSTTLGQTANPFQGFMGQNTMTPSGLTAAAQGTQPSGSTKQPSSGHDYEMLGDLHLKQGQYQAAAETFKKAIGAYESELKADRPADYQMALSKLLARQAQAQIALGHNDQASELLNQAKTAGAKYTARAPETNAPSKPRVPTKLIISATRRQLAALAGGQMNFDEFRRAASVEDE
jgi:tetratricopeptide (TPR) repeat protein